MTAMAAAQLGYRSHIFSPDADSPAFQVADAVTVAAYEDEAALVAFASVVDLVTFEFENIPAGCVRVLDHLVPVRPGPRALEIAQDRLAEKSFLNSLGIATAPWRNVRERGQLDAAVAEIGCPCVLKTARFGYDGKGQIKIENAADLDAAWTDLGGQRAILEGWIDYRCEASVIVARGLDGTAACFEPAENTHRNHILHRTIVPAPSLGDLGGQAKQIALRAAEALDLVGLLAVELFITAEGTLIANEIAPRPHNSGHWTMDACATSQFEQLVRAICGLPLGNTERHSDAEMTNLIGDEADDWRRYLGEPHTCLHLYGKAESRPGRKMGHVTRLSPRRVNTGT
jgi:5-(carboxyamino)imidazole ribonucleotide synthase